MKKTFSVTLIIAIFLSINCFALDNGLYQGNFLMYVDNPTQCSSAVPGFTRIINLEDSKVCYQTVVFDNGEEIVVEEKICKIVGPTIHCPPIDQIIDFAPWGLDAILTNVSDSGVGIIINNQKFRINHSVRRNYCEGSDCSIIEQWMGTSFPCNIGPWQTEFMRNEE